MMSLSLLAGMTVAIIIIKITNDGKSKHTTIVPTEHSLFAWLTLDVSPHLIVVQKCLNDDIYDIYESPDMV